MLRSAAVTRIQDGLGFATRQEANIINRLQEAQRDLEKGKTLPKFLLQENATLNLIDGTSTVALPTGFLRIADDYPVRFIATGETSPTFIRIVRDYSSAYRDNYSGEIEGPKIGVIRNAVIDFINTVDTNYTVYWSYYKAADVLSTDIENAWLANAPEWLIGEAGYRLAMDLRDKEGVTIFDSLRTKGRAACFGEIIASEEASGPIMMGANL